MLEQLKYEYFLVGLKLEEIDEVLSDLDLDLDYESLRVVGENDCITTEHRPNRFNIIHKDGIVTQVYYG